MRSLSTTKYHRARSAPLTRSARLRKLVALVENDELVEYAAGEGGMISPKGLNTLKKVIEGQKP